MTTRYTRGGVTVTIGKSQEVQLPSRVVRARCACMHFDTDKSFLLPPSMPAVRNLTRFYAQHRGLTVLVNGHTDLVGSAAYNRQLSDERAASIASFLQDKVDDWLAWYSSGIASKRWGATEDQYMLQTLVDAGGAPYHQGTVTGTYDPVTRDALGRFQADRGLTSDGLSGPETRRALVTAYMALEGTSLPADTAIATHGCGKTHPVDATSGADEGNRRVEVFLFDGPVDPAPVQPCPPGGCSQYAVWVDESVEVVDLCDPGLYGTVWIRLELMVDDARASTDKLILRTDDGYEQQHVIASDHIAADGAGEAVDIEFTDAPVDGVFTLTIVPSEGDIYALFTDVPFSELGILGFVPANTDDASPTKAALPPEAVAGIDQSATDIVA
jgi:outer membrane protein OmpA-like peptidoglycan-associated protein